MPLALLMLVDEWRLTRTLSGMFICVGPTLMGEGTAISLVQSSAFKSSIQAGLVCFAKKRLKDSASTVGKYPLPHSAPPNSAFGLFLLPDTPCYTWVLSALRVVWSSCFFPVFGPWAVSS